VTRLTAKVSDKFKAEQRGIEIERSFRDGQTMQSIADIYGLSRERIRQILDKRGLIFKDGGKHVQAQRSAAVKLNRRASKRNLMTLHYYGCSHAEALAINGGKPISTPDYPVWTFRESRRQAVSVGYEWDISIKDWWAIWQASGKWEQRGRKAESYALFRKDNQGPFSADNLEVVTFSQGISHLRKCEIARGRWGSK
jgi:hypothetical protein